MLAEELLEKDLDVMKESKMPDNSVPHSEPSTFERVWYAGQCHCGGVKFSASASRNLTITRCNCRICFMSGHQELMVPEDRFKLHSGQEFLKPYRFGNCIAD